jgi:signal peptidase I
VTEIGSVAASAPFGRATLLRRSPAMPHRRRLAAPAPGASSFGGRLGRGLAALLVTAAALVALAVSVGWLTPVVTFGTSMLPTYHAGDLVIVARGSDYAVGDIVGYRASGSEQIVLHRIVGGDAASGFEMRGDNNASVDPYAPKPADIVGRAIIHVPKVGVLVRSRAGVVGLLGGVMLLGLVTVGSTEPYASRRRIDRRLRQFQRRRERASRARHPTALPAPPHTGGAPPWLLPARPRAAPRPSTGAPEHGPPTIVMQRVRHEPDDNASPDHRPAAAPTGTAASTRQPAGRATIAALAVLIVADVLLAAALVAAFAMPPRTDPPAAAARQTAALRYGATVVPGVAYPAGRIETGQPVFRQIADRIDVSIDYDLVGRPAGIFRAEASLWLEVLSTSGWSRTTVLASGPVTTLPARLAGTVDLSETAAIVAALSAETGVATGASAVRIGATVTPSVDGLVGAASTTTMDFDLSDKALVMRASDQVTLDAVGGPAMASTTDLDEASAAADEHGGIPRAWRRWIMIALVVTGALTALAWPTRPTSNVVTVSRLDLSPHLTRIRMDDPSALDEIAAHERAPVLAGEGWRAVIVEQRLYWDGDHEPSSAASSGAAPMPG